MSGTGTGVRFNPFPALEDIAIAIDAPDRSALLGRTVEGERLDRLNALNERRAAAVYAAAEELGSMSAAYRHHTVRALDREIDALLGEGAT